MRLPVRNAQGQIYGVASADVLLKTLVEKLTWAAAYDGGYAYLLDRNGTILLHPKKPCWALMLFNLLTIRMI